MHWIITLIWLHFLSDFVLQTDRMALNKSSSNRWLFYHVATYTLPFAAVFPHQPLFVLLNGFLHFAIDYMSSRATKRSWEEKKRHLFFVEIGFDQALHLTCLVSTYVWIIERTVQ